jgi:hypothetical protein
MKEIHFYKDPNYEDDIDMYHTHNGTIRVLEDHDEIIHTTAISVLCSFSWLLEEGYKIYLHENGKEFEIKEGSIEATDKEIRKGHNIMKMWIAGAFKDYFYEQS